MTEWLRLKDIRDPIEATPRPGVRLDVVVSPYDVPEAVRGFRTSDGHFRIEFRYIDGPEPHGPELRVDDYVTVIEGKLTRRLQALEVDLDALGAQSIGLSISTSASRSRLKERLEAALDRVAAQRVSVDEQRVVANTRTALRTREDDLLDQLADV